MLRALGRAGPRCRCSTRCCGVDRRSKAHWPPHAHLSPPDRALALAIAGETLRRLPDLDALIDSATRQRLPGDRKARMVLRLALAQKMVWTRPTTRWSRPHCLWSMAARAGWCTACSAPCCGAACRRSTPRPCPSRSRSGGARHGARTVVAAARRQIAKRPPLDLSFAEAAEAQAYATEHGGVSLAPGHVRVESAAVADLPGFGEGRWWVQDLAASLPARLIPASATDVLDLCAAPGGKTMQLAAAGHRVTAVDSSESRLGRLRENLERTHSPPSSSRPMR